MFAFLFGTALGSFLGWKYGEKVAPKRNLLPPAQPITTPSLPGPSQPLALSTFAAGVVERILNNDASLSPQEITLLQGELGLPPTGALNAALYATLTAHAHPQAVAAAAQAAGYAMGCYSTGMNGYAMSGYAV